MSKSETTERALRGALRDFGNDAITAAVGIVGGVAVFLALVVLMELCK